MKKLFIILTLGFMVILGACTAPKMIQSQEEAKQLSINKLIMYQGVIYKDQFEYGKYSEIKTDVLDELITYQNRQMNSLILCYHYSHIHLLQIQFL